MNTRPSFRFRRITSLVCHGLAFVLAAGTARCAHAETLKVTTWNIESLAQPVRGTNGAVEAAATVLKRLAPDVVLLQGVRNWTMCDQLAQALQPTGFKVAVCSDFPPSGLPAQAQGQVAILCRSRAFFTWSEPWRDAGGKSEGGGFAFAAIQAGAQRVGLFSSQFGPLAASEGAARQLLNQVATLSHWEVNRVQNFILAASFESSAVGATPSHSPVLHVWEDAGFLDALLPRAAIERLTLVPRAGRPGGVADYLLVQAATFPTRSQVSPVVLADHYPVTCELELEPTKAATEWTAWARETEVRAQARSLGDEKRVAQAQTSFWTTLRESPGWPAVVLVGFVLMAGASLWAWKRRRRARRRAIQGLIPDRMENLLPTTSSYTVVMMPSGFLSAPDAAPPALIASGPDPGLKPSAEPQAASAAWQQRALQAEAQAARAHEVIRSGVLPQLRQWLKQRVLRKLLSERSDLLQVQAAATQTAMNVDQRLTRIERQIQEQNRAYEKRIEELTCELVAAKEESRELIRARILQVKAEMEAARARVLAEAEEL